MFKKHKKEQQKSQNPELKPAQQSMRRWLWVIVGVAVFLAGIGVGLIWQQDRRNSLLAMITIAVCSGGIYIIYIGIKRREPSSVVVVPGVAKPKGPVNSLNIFAKKNSDGKCYPEKIIFENMAKPEGQPQQCLNDNRWYYVHIWDLAKNTLVPFILPDTRYTDPAFMARYLELPAQRKYLRHRETWQKYIGPAILAVMNGAGLLVIIAMAG